MGEVNADEQRREQTKRILKSGGVYPPAPSTLKAQKSRRYARSVVWCPRYELNVRPRGLGMEARRFLKGSVFQMVSPFLI